MLFNKEVFNKMLDFIEEAMYDTLACDINLQEDLTKEDKGYLVDTCEVLTAVNKLRSINWDDYNDEEDIIIKKDE